MSEEFVFQASCPSDPAEAGQNLLDRILKNGFAKDVSEYVRFVSIMEQNFGPVCSYYKN